MIDPNEAPEGCIAEVWESCDCCCYSAMPLSACKKLSPSCSSNRRKDKTNAQFKRLESQQRGTAEILADMEKLMVEMRRLL